MKTSLEISPTQLLYVTKQNLYKKLSNTRKTFLHRSEIWLETYNIGKKLSLTHLKLEAFNNLKILSCTHLKLQHWNFLTTWRTFFHALFQTWTLKLSTTWKTFFHTLTLTTLWRSLFHTSHSLGKVASSSYATTWKWTPTYFPNKKTYSQKDSPLFLCNISSKPFTTSCSNTMSFLLLGVGP